MTKKKPKTKAKTEVVIRNKFGRPTKYKPEYCQGMVDFFNKREVIIAKDDKGKLLIRSEFPIYAGYAAEIGVHIDTLNEWSNVHKDFSEAYKKVKDIQHQTLVSGAMNGMFNPTFSIFFAKNNLGYRNDPQPEDKKDSLKREHSKKLYEAIKKAI